MMTFSRTALCRCAVVMIVAAAGLLLAFQPAQASVTLLNFTLTAQNQSVTAHWQMASESGLTGFYLQRGTTAAGSFQRTSAFIPASGDLLMGGSYQVTDPASLTSGQIYYYRLEALQLDQTSLFFDPASVTIGATATATPTPTPTQPSHPPAAQPSPTPQTIAASQNQSAAQQATAYPAPQPAPSATPAATAITPGADQAATLPAYPAVTSEPLFTPSATVPPYPAGQVPTLIQGVTNNPTQSSNEIMLPGLSFGNMSPTAEPAKLPDFSDPKSAPWVIGAIVLLGMVWILLKWLQGRDETPKL